MSTLLKPRLDHMEQSRLKFREYRAPLTVLASGVLGFSLFCIVSAVALSNPGAPNVAAMQPQDFVDSAISNISTVAALTVESISEYIPTPTLSPSNTSTITSPDQTHNTATLIPTRTSLIPTSTRRGGATLTSTPTPLPTRTNTPVPPTDTNTPVPTFTHTPVPPTDTDTPVPPTDTPVPPTDTDVPPTDTSEPPPTNTDEPVSTFSVNDVTENSP